MRIKWLYKGIPEYIDAEAYCLSPLDLIASLKMTGQLGGITVQEDGSLEASVKQRRNFKTVLCPFTGRLELHLFIGKAQRMVWLFLEEGKLIQAEDVTDIAIKRLQRPLGE